MLLSDIFSTLAFGELAELSIGDSGDILLADYPKVITSVNLGLLELYKQFPIKTEELTLQLYDHITLYHLDTEYAQSNVGSSQTYKYILDATTVVPFTDNILLITNVFDEICKEYALNDSACCDSVYTPTQTTLHIPFPVANKIFSLIYRTTPEKISVAITDPTLVKIELPPQFLEAITLYVAYRIFAGISVGQERPEAAFYLSRYNAAIALIKSEGIFNSDSNRNGKFEANGWA